MRKIAYKQVLVKKAQADWLKTVQNWAKEAPSWWNQFTSENRWARPVIYGLGGSLLAGLATGGMSNSFARLLTILLSGGSLAALGAHHNTQQDIQNLSKHSINTSTQQLNDARTKYQHLSNVTASDVVTPADKKEAATNPSFAQAINARPAIDITDSRNPDQQYSWNQIAKNMGYGSDSSVTRQMVDDAWRHSNQMWKLHGKNPTATKK